MSAYHAEIAKREFKRRFAALQRAHSAGTRDADQVNRNARLWLAIAARAGTDLCDIGYGDLLAPAVPRALLAEDIACGGDYLGELARAARVAYQKWLTKPDDFGLRQRMEELRALCWELGGYDLLKPCERRAAA